MKLEKIEMKIKMVEEFYRMNGRLPKYSEQSPEGEKIGAFLNRIKQRKTKITEDQLKRLETLGFTMEIKDVRQSIEMKIRLVEEFYKENGRLPNQKEKSSEGEKIGTFLSRIKQGKTKITEEQLKRLETLGFTKEIKDVRQSIEMKVRLVEEFYRMNGRLPKYSEQSPKGEKIGAFLNRIKQRKTKITEEQLKRLETLGFTMEIKRKAGKTSKEEAKIKASKNEKIKMIEEFYRKNGRLPYYYEKSSTGENIGIFINNAKNGNLKLTNEELWKLERLGVVFKKMSKEEHYEEMIKQIEKFYQFYGRMPTTTERSVAGDPIGTFLNKIQKGNVTITEEQRQRLTRIGVTIANCARTKQIEELKQLRDELLKNQKEEINSVVKCKKK